jgi:hypothetical protein
VVAELFRKPAGALRLRAVLPDDDVLARFRLDVRCGHAGHGNLTLMNVNSAFARFVCEFFDAIHTRLSPF